MADAILKRIRDNLVTAVAGIIKGATYKRTINSVDRRNKHVENPGENTALVLYGEGNIVGGNQASDDREHTFHVVVVVGDVGDEDPDDVLMDFVQDVHKAVRVDKTRGGIAYWTQATGEVFDDDQVDINVTVNYPTGRDDISSN